MKLSISPLVLKGLLNAWWESRETQVLTSEVLLVPGGGCVREGLARGGVHGKQA